VKKLIALLMIGMSLFLFGCGGPPSKILNNALQLRVAKVAGSETRISSARGFSIGNGRYKYEITNKYEREINGAKAFFYEYEIKFHPESNTQQVRLSDSGTVIFIKKGNRWDYAFQ
jgi:hypothetical protein